MLQIKIKCLSKRFAVLKFSVTAPILDRPPQETGLRALDVDGCQMPALKRRAVNIPQPGASVARM